MSPRTRLMAIGAVVAMALVTAGLVAADRLSLRYRPVTIVDTSKGVTPIAELF